MYMKMYSMYMTLRWKEAVSMTIFTMLNMMIQQMKILKKEEKTQYYSI